MMPWRSSKRQRQQTELVQLILMVHRDQIDGTHRFKQKLQGLNATSHKPQVAYR